MAERCPCKNGASAGGRAALIAGFWQDNGRILTNTKAIACGIVKLTKSPRSPEMAAQIMQPGRGVVTPVPEAGHPVGCPAFLVKGRGSMSSNDAFYHRKRHKEWRRKVLARAEHKCEICKRYGRVDRDGLPVAATTAHHVLHADTHPERRYDVSNGIALCQECHNKQHPDKGRRRGSPAL